MLATIDWAGFWKGLQDQPCFWVLIAIAGGIVVLLLIGYLQMRSDSRKAVQKQKLERLMEEARIKREKRETLEKWEAEAAWERERNERWAKREAEEKRQNLQKFVAFFPSIRSKTLTLSRAAKECEQDLVEATKMYEDWLKTQPALPSKTPANPKVLNCPACTAAIPPNAQGRYLCGSCGSTVQL